MALFAALVFLTASALADPIPDPEVVHTFVSPVSFGPLYTGIHNVDAKHIPGTVAYSKPSLVYYGRKKREADPDPEVVGSVVSPFAYGPVYTGIHNLDTTHIPGTITYGSPQFVYYGRKKREAEPDPEVVHTAVSPISFGPLYTGIHSVDAKHIPGTVTYSAPTLVYYGRKKREAEPDPEVVGSVVSPFAYGPVYTGVHNVDTTHIPGTITYGSPQFVYYGRKKREAEPDPEVVHSAVSPFSFGPLYTGIHNVDAKHIPGTVTYSAPNLVYYGRKKREAGPDPEVVGSVVSPFTYGPVYTGIHNVDTTHIPGTVTYGSPSFFYYGKKK